MIQAQENTACGEMLSWQKRGDSAEMKSKYDGPLREYHFGPDHYSAPSWKVKADSLSKAVRAFRVGGLYPHQYVDLQDRIAERPFRGGDEVYLSSKPGATVPVRVLVKDGQDGRPKWEVIHRIAPEGNEAEDFSSRALPSAVQGQLEGHVSESTALTTAGSGRLPVDLGSASRSVIERKQLELQALQNDLKRQMSEVRQEIDALKAEVKKRLEQIWAIELFLGVHEDVKCLAEGQPAPADTPISIHQRTLCIDEEIALWQWFNDPERIGSFDIQELGEFDRWLVSDPEHLSMFLPEPKGIVALRIRRKVKDRHAKDFATAWANAELAESDRKTYLLIRNGDNIYRIWADVDLWPRFFPRLNEFDWLNANKHIWESDKIAAREQMKNFIGGLLAVQGLISRSDLLHPLPSPRLDIFNPEDVERYFSLVRDDEEQLLLGDGDSLHRLTWSHYKKWLQGQAREGCRVLYTGGRDLPYSRGENPLYERTGIQSLYLWPDDKTLYVLQPKAESSWRNHSWSFLYLPGDTVYPSDPWEHSRGRKRRVRFCCYDDEVIPFDAISPRVVEHLLRDRSQREFYMDFFTTLFRWWDLRKKEEEAERPLVDLILGRADVDRDHPEERPRCERLVRWWKLKTKTARTISEDDSKAVRMIHKAFSKGEDYLEDPETLLMDRLSGREA